MDYPLGRLYDEAALVQERENNRIITEAELIQSAIHSLLSKPARGRFKKLIKSLNVVVKAHGWLFGEDNEAQSSEQPKGKHSSGLWD